MRDDRFTWKAGEAVITDRDGNIIDPAALAAGDDENLVPMPGAERLAELKAEYSRPSTKYAVYWEGDLQAEFDTYREAQEYVKRDIKGTAETYGHTQKWVQEHFRWTIEKVAYI